MECLRRVRRRLRTQIAERVPEFDAELVDSDRGGLCWTEAAAAPWAQTPGAPAE